MEERVLEDVVGQRDNRAEEQEEDCECDSHSLGAPVAERCYSCSPRPPTVSKFNCGDVPFEDAGNGREGGIPQHIKHVV